MYVQVTHWRGIKKKKKEFLFDGVSNSKCPFQFDLKRHICRFILGSPKSWTCPKFNKNELGGMPSSSVFWKKLCKFGAFFLQCLIKFSSETIWAWRFSEALFFTFYFNIISGAF